MKNDSSVTPYQGLISEWLQRVETLRRPRTPRPAPRTDPERVKTRPSIRSKGHLRLVHSR